MLNKILLLFIVCGGFFSCNCEHFTTGYKNVYDELKIANDSIIVLNRSLELEKVKQDIVISDLIKADSTISSLRQKLFVSNYKLGRIKEYCSIVKKDNSQLKYLVGWINRVLED